MTPSRDHRRRADRDVADDRASAHLRAPARHASRRRRASLRSPRGRLLPRDSRPRQVRFFPILPRAHLPLRRRRRDHPHDARDVRRGRDRKRVFGLRAGGDDREHVLGRGGCRLGPGGGGGDNRHGVQLARHGRSRRANSAPRRPRRRSRANGAGDVRVRDPERAVSGLTTPPLATQNSSRDARLVARRVFFRFLLQRRSKKRSARRPEPVTLVSSIGPLTRRSARRLPPRSSADPRR